jgi:5-methylthioribose kinase
VAYPPARKAVAEEEHWWTSRQYHLPPIFVINPQPAWAVFVMIIVIHPKGSPLRPMREVTPETAAEYLRETGRVARDEAVAVRALGWGVSNVVLRVEVEGGPPFVLKQARERLRTRAHWVSRLDRIWTEHAALVCLASLLPAGTVPQILFDDRDNYLFAMTSAPDDAVVWKEQLLALTTERDAARAALAVNVAREAGALLGMIHASTLDHPALTAGPLADTVVFDQLRIDPFYRTIIRVHPDLAAPVEALCTPLPAPARRCFVHADFSPKNILVHSRGLTLVDFETAHAGDPAFDLGFFLSHLYLKAYRPKGPDPAATRRSGAAAVAFLELVHEFLAAYRANPAVAAVAGPHSLGDSPPVSWHTAACMLARVDGKSPVDYLDDAARLAVRARCLEILRRAPAG